MRTKLIVGIGLLSLIVLAAAVFMSVPVERAKLIASDGEVGDRFGEWLAVSGTTVVLGAPGDDAPETDSGSGYIYQLNQLGWVEKAKLTASDGGSGDELGFTVAIDGNTAVLTAPFHDGLGVDSGAAYIFENQGGSWIEVAKLTASDPKAGALFAWTAAIEGNTILIGTPESTGFPGDSIGNGSAYIFQRRGSDWVETAKLTASDGQFGDRFGRSVKIDGNRVGITAEDDDDLGTNSGSAYIFEKKGLSWVEVAKLTASDGEAGDTFGQAMDVSGDYAAVSAPGEDTLGQDAGAVYIFERDRSGWNEVAKLTASDGAAYSYFGGVEVALDDKYLVVGSWGAGPPEPDAGAAYLFKRISRSEWNEIAKLTGSDSSAYDQFGLSVGIDGNLIVAGALAGDGLALDTGSAYIFELIPEPPPYP